MELSVLLPPTEILTLDEKPRCFDFKQPYQIAFTSNDDLLVVESMHYGRVIIVREDSLPRDSEFRKSVPEPDKLNNPQGIATAADGSVYILYDTSASKKSIVKYNQDGESVGEFSDKKSQLKRPGRMKFQEGKNLLYVCDRGRNCFQVFDSELNFLSILGVEERLYADVAFGDDDTMYLSCKAGNSVCKFDKNGKELLHIGKKDLLAPRGLLYLNGRLYVADRNNKRIAVFATVGDHRLVHCLTDERCRDPGSIVADKDGKLYICDERGGHVFVF